MQISARNQISGKVEKIEKGEVNSQIYIKLKDDISLVSVITQTAVSNLNIKIDDEVIAIFKSSNVLLMTDTNLNISARNKIDGIIDYINKGDVNSEVVIDIGNTNKIASVITTNSIESLNLKEGMKVSAIVKSSDVMIGK